MKAWIDSDNVIHMGGRPRFVIGLYDTTGYGLRPDYYAPRLKEIARAPINLMINYLLSDGRADVIYPYTEAMKPFGIFYLATVNAFFPKISKYPPQARTEHLDADEFIAQYSKALAGDSRVVGYYTCDECASEAVPRTFHQYGLIKQNDPASVTFAVENYPDEFQFWRDTVDVLGVDPYVFGTRHPESYVGDMTRKAVAAVHGARPVWTVIQFFRLSPLSHFPTGQELHDMSWMAITEGARGVFYWSYGLRGLDWGRRDPVLRQHRYDELVSVTRGISALEPVLLAPDSPVLSANSRGRHCDHKGEGYPGRKPLPDFVQSQRRQRRRELYSAAARPRIVGVRRESFDLAGSSRLKIQRYLRAISSSHLQDRLNCRLPNPFECPSASKIGACSGKLKRRRLITIAATR